MLRANEFPITLDFRTPPGVATLSGPKDPAKLILFPVSTKFITAYHFAALRKKSVLGALSQIFAA